MKTRWKNFKNKQLTADLHKIINKGFEDEVGNFVKKHGNNPAVMNAPSTRHHNGIRFAQEHPLISAIDNIAKFAGNSKVQKRHFTILKHLLSAPAITLD